MSIETAPVNGIEIAYETFGERDGTPLLLIMGLGTQMLGWPDEFCEQLAERGLFVVRFDNRDIGLSTHMSDAPDPDVMALLSGDTSSAVYRLEDMADDAAGLIGHLGLDSAHVVGVSMGGMIGQTLAINHPERVRSLVSIMSTTGDPSVGAPEQEALTALMRPVAQSKEEAIEGTVHVFRTIGSPGFEFDEEMLRERASLSYDRSYDPPGFNRQLAAIFASGDRTDRLREVRAPTTVIHGDSDPLVGVSGGHATAAAIPGCEVEIVAGMGHDLPRELWPRFLDRIVEAVERGESARSETAASA
jgi:pimeloyl-ACP methyl ester carboxylesterase